MKLIVNLFVRNPKKTEKFVLKCAAEKKNSVKCVQILKKITTNYREKCQDTEIFGENPS